jgi:16S rRNA A1518/A1519 N6-dimethyltransferase RsmA/KsgA/DIM1 with predicted DNA glycosylase/AP lyase activity
MVRSLFASRRKTIANNLMNFLLQSCKIKNTEERDKWGRDMIMTALESCCIDPKERAENLSYENFSALAGSLEALYGSIK